jgi:hypothetical protein
MRIGLKAALAISMVATATGPAVARFWDCAVPEIDGAAGISAVAAVVSLAMIAYHRLTH